MKGEEREKEEEEEGEREGRKKGEGRREKMEVGRRIVLLKPGEEPNTENDERN